MSPIKRKVFLFLWNTNGKKRKSTRDCSLRAYHTWQVQILLGVQKYSFNLPEAQTQRLICTDLIGVFNPLCNKGPRPSCQQTLGCVNRSFLTSPNYTSVWPALRYPTVSLWSLPEKPEGIIWLNSYFLHTSHLDEHWEYNYRIHTALKIH